jgi:hypothetical protein
LAFDRQIEIRVPTDQDLCKKEIKKIWWNVAIEPDFTSNIGQLQQSALT